MTQMKRQKTLTLNKVHKPLGALPDDGTGMISLPRRVPKDIEFQVRWLAIMPADEVVHPRLHGLLSDCQCQLRILRIAARPELGPDLVP